MVAVPPKEITPLAISEEDIRAIVQDQIAKMADEKVTTAPTLEELVKLTATPEGVIRALTRQAVQKTIIEKAKNIVDDEVSKSKVTEVKSV